MTKFDVVIGTVSTTSHPQHKFLPSIIKNLQKQNVGDIFICEDGKSPLIERAVGTFRVKHFTQPGPRFRLAKNLNRGLLATTRPTIVIMGDSLPSKHLIEEYDKVYEEGRIFSGVRYYVNKPGGKVIEKDWRLDILKDIDMLYTPWRRFTGNNWCASNKVLKQLKGWDENFEGYGFEDFDFALRAYIKGIRFTPVMKAVVYHVNHPKVGENETNQLLWFRREQMFYKKAKLDIKLKE